MATATLTTQNETAEALGVHEYNEALQLGTVPEGAAVGKLVLLKFAQEQSIPMALLRDIYLNAGLSEDQLPRARSSSDAWRIATSELNGKTFSSRRFRGSVRVLVREWKGGKDPRRDITLERQNGGSDCFEYASPAAVITFEPNSNRMAWDNRAYEPDLENMLDAARERFEVLKQLVDGEAIYRSLRRVIERTSPMPMGQGAYLIWNEHNEIVKAVASIVAALNTYNPNTEQSVANIFTVVNTEQDRETLSSSLNKTVKKEVQEALERMGRIMGDPTRLIESQGRMELENYSSLKKLVDEFDTRFKKDRRELDTHLDLLLEQHMDLLEAIAQNKAKKAREADLLKASLANIQ